MIPIIKNTTAMDIIPRIQAARKSWQEPDFPNLEERKDTVFNALELIAAHPELHTKFLNLIDGNYPLLSRELHTSLDHLKQSLEKTWGQKPAYFIPTGVISVFLPKDLAPFRWLQTWSHGFLSGNRFLFKWSSRSAVEVEALQSFFELLGKTLEEKTDPATRKAFNLRNFGSHFLFDKSLRGDHDPNPDNEMIVSLFLNHPSIQGVQFWGNQSSGEKLLTGSNLSSKKIQFFYGGSHSVVYVDQEGLPKIDELKDWLTQTTLSGASRSFTSHTKLFLLGSQINAVISNLIKDNRFKILNTVTGADADLKFQTLDNVEQIYQQIEHQKNWNQIHVALEASHCTDLQQKALPAPFIIVNPVKYTHEISKWLNSNFMGPWVSYFGDPAKSQSLLTKSEIGGLAVNPQLVNWMDFVGGVKQSTVGFRNCQAFDDFFIDRQKII